MNQNRWMIYFKERFPILPNLIVAAGMTYSAFGLVSGQQSINDPAISKFLALIGGMLFLAQLRFMDELKDYEKDKIAHPDRPLPRGLFTTKEFSRFIVLTQASMILYALMLILLHKISAGIFFAIGVGYLYLMYREFFLGTWLSKRAILYAITHQIIIYPLALFIVSLFHDEFWRTIEACHFGTMILGAFFAFEVGRKLDPNAHPLLNTYLIRYKKLTTAFLIVGMLVLSAWNAQSIDVGLITIPFSILAILSLSVLWLKPSSFKIAEGMVSLYLMISLWAIPIMSLIRGNS